MRCLRIPRQKKAKICGAFRSHVVGECLVHCPNSKKTPLPKKTGYAPEEAEFFAYLQHN